MLLLDLQNKLSIKKYLILMILLIKYPSLIMTLVFLNIYYQRLSDYFLKNGGPM